VLYRVPVDRLRNLDELRYPTLVESARAFVGRRTKHENASNNRADDDHRHEAGKQLWPGERCH
jgi:hypothetical protein